MTNVERTDQATGRHGRIAGRVLEAGAAKQQAAGPTKWMEVDWQEQWAVGSEGNRHPVRRAGES